MEPAAENAAGFVAYSGVLYCHCTDNRNTGFCGEVDRNIIFQADEVM